MRKSGKGRGACLSSNSWPTLDEQREVTASISEAAVEDILRGTASVMAIVPFDPQSQNSPDSFRHYHGMNMKQRSK